MNNMSFKKPILLAILDGWGLAKPTNTNAVYAADMKFVKYLKQTYPTSILQASGEAVGLPEGQMGNSEVGHIHIGAGRINLESLQKINDVIKNNQLSENAIIKKAITHIKKTGGNFHLMGLFSDGGVHSHLNHLLNIFNVLVQADVKNIFFHLIGDGRDTAPKAIHKYLAILQDKIKKYKCGTIASIAGRFYTMDRDRRYQRLMKGYQAIINHIGPEFNDPATYITAQYNLNHTDEFLEPAINSDPIVTAINENDVLFFTNFRPDRAIQFSAALTNPDYAWHPPIPAPKVFFMTMTTYSKLVYTPYVCFPAVKLQETLGQYISAQGLKQLRIAETEKIAHVTFFFDGGNDYFNNGQAKQINIKLKGANSILIPSPKVETYDLAPEMSATLITDRLVAEINKNPYKYDLIVLNFANGDMVGHTGVLKAAITANKILDACLKRLYGVVEKAGGLLVITADHGNCETMLDPITKNPYKAHTINPVPLIITDNNIKLKPEGALHNIAPTILDLLGLAKPKIMISDSLLIKK